jgi:Bacterial TSP3 repeat
MSHAANTSPFFAAGAAAISAAGMIMTPASAHAYPQVPLAPACSEFERPGRNYELQQSNGFRVTFGNLHWGETRSTDRDGAQKNRGLVYGNVTGRSIDFRIFWDGGATGNYTGTIDDNGFAHGETFDESNPASRATWDALVPLRCESPAAGEPPAGERPDRDNDGLFDDDETNVYGTNPDVSDTDGDGRDDGQEVYDKTDPLDPNSFK